MNISTNFRLEEFLVSQTAARHGIDMTPPLEIQHNITELVDTILQPLRDEIKSPIVVSSGYRPPALNRLIGGSETSAHMEGRAADFTVINYSPFRVCEIIRNMDLPFDQVICEFDQWVHAGIAQEPRREMLTAYRAEGGVRYVQGIHANKIRMV